MRKAKVHLQLNLGKDRKGNRKDVYRAINNKRQISKNEGLDTEWSRGEWTWKRVRYPVPSSPQPLLIKSALRSHSSLTPMRKAGAMKFYAQEDHITEY